MTFLSATGLRTELFLLASTIKTTSDIHDFFATAAPSISVTFVKYPGLQSTDAPHAQILDGWGRAKILQTKSYAFGE